MSFFWDLGLFVVIMALGQFSPGPDMLLLTRTALREGLRPACQMAAGIATGLAIHGTLAISGMAWLLNGHGQIVLAVKILAVIYLLYLVIGLLREAFAAWRAGTKIDFSVKIPQSRSPYVRGFLCNILNPKALLFFAGVITPFLSQAHPAWWPALLCLVMVVQSLTLWCLWAWVLQHKKVRATYNKYHPALDATFGFALLLIAALLARSLFTV